MKGVIYVQLLNEGTTVYRPVRASKIKINVYKIDNFDFYDSDDEIWEFLPGTVVIVEERYMENENVLVAVNKYEKKWH